MRRRDGVGYLGVQPRTTFSPLSQAERHDHGADGRVSSTEVLLVSICESSARSQPSELLIDPAVSSPHSVLVGRDRLGDKPLGASPCPALPATLFTGRRSSGELAGVGCGWYPSIRFSSPPASPSTGLRSLAKPQELQCKRTHRDAVCGDSSQRTEDIASCAHSLMQWITFGGAFARLRGTCALPAAFLSPRTRSRVEPSDPPWPPDRWVDDATAGQLTTHRAHLCRHAAPIFL
ncbi:hypothetical protein VTO73DRAFT_2476 [Trametes versicolor]